MNKIATVKAADILREGIAILGGSGQRIAAERRSRDCPDVCGDGSATVEIGTTSGDILLTGVTNQP